MFSAVQWERVTGTFHEDKNHLRYRVKFSYFLTRPYLNEEYFWPGGQRHTAAKM